MRTRAVFKVSLISVGLAVVAALFLPIAHSWMAMPLAAFAVGSFAFAVIKHALQRRPAEGTRGDVTRNDIVRTQRLLQLGVQRRRILACLGGDVPNSGHYFDPALREDVFAAFRAFVQARVGEAGGDADPVTQSLLGAARLLIGDLSGARVILRHLPTTPPVRDHLAGVALVAPVEALRAALPLGRLDLAPPSSWSAGSEARSVVGTWLDQHGASLIWNERDAVYELPDAPSHGRGQ